MELYLPAILCFISSFRSYFSQFIHVPVTFSFPTFIFHFILYTHMPQSIYLKLDIFTDHEEHNKTI
jgi:hypothetical protein